MISTILSLISLFTSKELKCFINIIFVKIIVSIIEITNLLIISLTVIIFNVENNIESNLPSWIIDITSVVSVKTFSLFAIFFVIISTLFKTFAYYLDTKFVKEFESNLGYRYFNNFFNKDFKYLTFFFISYIIQITMLRNENQSKKRLK